MPPTTMFPYHAPDAHAAPPVPWSVAIALASALGSGGKAVGTDETGCGATPAAHGFGFTTTTPAERLAVVPVAPHVGVTWPVTSVPSAQMAVVEPELAPA